MSVTIGWLTGFTEAEGCFSCRSKKVNGYTYQRPEFSISQKERRILEKIKDFLGCGEVKGDGLKGVT